VSAVRTLKGGKDFSQSVRPMVSVAVSKLGKTELVFVQPGTKINRTQTRFTAGNSPFLEQRLCVQAGGSAMHAIHDTVAYLHSNVPEFVE